MENSIDDTMENSFLASLQQLELMAFFSGYPLIYSIIRSAAGNRPSEGNLRSRLLLLMPVAYAFLGTLYLGLQFKELYPDYSAGHIGHVMGQNYLKIWGILAILFWIPALRRRPALSLYHSLIFILLLAADLYRQFSGGPAQKDGVRNDMSMYTISLLLNLGVYALVILFSLLGTRYRKNSVP
jgi:hypothetical protein